MSPCSSLLSPASHAHADDHRVLGGDVDDDMAAVSSYLSLDAVVDDVADEKCYRPPLGEEEEASATAEFRLVQQGPLFFATLQAQDDYCFSGSGAEHEQSLPDASSSVLSSAAPGNDNHDRMYLTLDGRSRRLLRSEHGKIAFKTRSDVDVLDDGYRWRKYRFYHYSASIQMNYYSCSSEGCRVKKRVERNGTTHASSSPPTTASITTRPLCRHGHGAIDSGSRCTGTTSRSKEPAASPRPSLSAASFC